jgi:23S rRNA pseudouridine955/2504/2580 synthase
MAAGDLRLGKQRYQLSDLLLYEDEHFWALNKPEGIASQDERFRPGSGLLSWAQQWDEQLQLCHRLDKDTSGVLLMARHPEAYRQMSLQFQERAVEKTYLALVAGSLSDAQVIIEAPILKSGRGGKARIDFQDGKDAATAVENYTTYRHYTLMRCFPHTGRMHQIRLHLAYVGCPIVGDRYYGGEDLYLSNIKRKYRPKAEQPERPINAGIALHAQRLRFLHPFTGATVEAEAPLNETMHVCLKLLAKYDQLSPA